MPFSTVESNTSERKNSYKAGLILRTSSFKERKSSSRESTPETSRKQTTGSFLTNTSKVTGIQDVITRMKTEERVEGDTSEDAEARQMLNKFLGSQVILAGMEGGTSTRNVMKSTTSTSASSTTTGNKRTTKVTTTVTASTRGEYARRAFYFLPNSVRVGSSHSQHHGPAFLYSRRCRPFSTVSKFVDAADVSRGRSAPHRTHRARRDSALCTANTVCKHRLLVYTNSGQRVECTPSR